MKISYRIEEKLRHPAFRAQVAERTESAIARASQWLREVTVTVWEETERGPGETMCRVTGRLHDGRELHVHGADPFPSAAVSRALGTFRRRLFQEVSRRRVSPMVRGRV